MIRPELIALARRWAEPAVAAGATFAALWIAGATSLRWGWLTLALSVIILTAGGLWVREAIRRVRLASGKIGGGRVYVEERRVLYLGALGNVQVDLDDVTRIDLAVSKSPGIGAIPGKAVTGFSPKAAAGQGLASVLLYSSGPPAAIPLNAEGEDALLDALCALPGFRLETLTMPLMRAGQDQSLVTIWRRG